MALLNNMAHLRLSFKAGILVIWLSAKVLSYATSRKWPPSFLSLLTPLCAGSQKMLKMSTYLSLPSARPFISDRDNSKFECLSLWKCHLFQLKSYLVYKGDIWGTLISLEFSHFLLLFRSSLLYFSKQIWHLHYTSLIFFPPLVVAKQI